jgi:glyoxylase-like metal-dependent hydrolase (beta-lactamase superfamily II)
MVDMEPKILKNLWQVGGAGFSSSEDAAIYLIRFGDKAALVDAGCGNGHDLLKINISECIPENVEIEYLLLTHCHFDHTGGAERVRQEYGCRIVAHTLDAIFLESGDSEVTAASWYGTVMQPLAIDVKIKGDSQSIKIGNGKITAHHCPGHSPGSLVYTTEMERKKVLFGQDVHGPLDATFRSDPKTYQTSLRKILEFDADILCEGHYGVYQGKDAVQRFIRSFLQ